MRLAALCLCALLLAGAANKNVGETVHASAVVYVNGPNLYQGATVNFIFTKPNGATVNLSAVSDASGKASVSCTLKKTDPTGTWRVNASSTVGTISGGGATTFTVY